MKLYYRILLSYLCVCLIPLSLSLFTIAKLEKNVQQTILEDHERMFSDADRSLRPEAADHPKSSSDPVGCHSCL